MSAGQPFVNRTDEIGRVRDLVAAIRQPAQLAVGAYLFENVVNVQGAPGIGKTALVGALAADLARHGLGVVPIDLRAEPPPPDLLHEKVRVCTLVLRELAPLLEPAVAELLTGPLEALQAAPTAEGIDGFADELVGVLRQVADGRPVALLIDSCEHASEALFAWLERIVLLPLVHDARQQTSRVICILASQMTLRWRQHNVRRRVRVEPLGPLTLEATALQAGDQPLGAAVYELTFGHPLSTAVALERIPPEMSAQVRADWARQHGGALSGEIVRRLQEHALRSLAAGRAGPPAPGEAAEVWSILEALSVVREFDVNSMREILSSYDPKYRERSQSVLLINVRELLETRLAEWSSSKRSYQIAASIRRIFANALKLREQGRYLALRQAAIAVYEQQIPVVQGNRNLYVIEYLFQLLSDPDLRPRGQGELVATINGLLGSYYASDDRSYLDLESLADLSKSARLDTEVRELLERRGMPANLIESTITAFAPELGP